MRSFHARRHALAGLGLISAVLTFPSTQAAVRPSVSHPATPQPAPSTAGTKVHHGVLGQPRETAFRTSSHYSITTETTDAGGVATASSHYSAPGASIGIVSGISGVTSPAEIVKAGYLGQIYNVAGLQVTAPGSSVNEGATIQLGAAQILDDLTTLAVAANAVGWSVASGSLESIDSDGLASATTVYENTTATARGTLGSFSGTLMLSVVNVNTDDFGSYAGDGIDDGWQVSYFGMNNPLAAPSVDADGTGQTNLFKYFAGLDPVDPNSRFVVSISPVAGQPGEFAVAFSPFYAGRTYTLQSTADLGQPRWGAVPSTSTTVNGTTCSVIDLGANGSPKFYRIQISMP